ncbi:unnamed protein product [Aphanomyces euteiches]
MGNKSSKPTAQEIEELKGPFSDEEFESLQALVSATQADKATFLERFSLGPLSGTTDDILVHFGEALYAAFATLADDPEATELSIAHVAKADLQHSWDRLYTSTQDGLSFNRLSYHLLGYTGPTLLVCTATDGATFGAYGDTPWKEGTKFFGGPGCFLFRLSPTFLLCPASAAQGLTNYMYYNTKGVVLPRGLGFGGTTSKFRLFLDDELDNCYTSLKCGSYEPGSISLKATFQIQTLEVWGCGGEESKLAQRGYRAETAELINRARKVDKAQFVGNSFDREMFLGKTFGHGTDAARIADDEH